MLNIYPFIVIWSCVSFLGWNAVFSFLEGQGNVPPLSFSAKAMGATIMTLVIGMTIGLAWFLTGLMFGYS